MSDAAFREALEDYVDASDDLSWYGSDHCRTPLETLQARKDIALARVLALYDEIVAERDDLMAIAIGDKVRKPSNPSLAERQGEVYEATDIHNRHGIRVRVIKVPPQEFGVGDRVWVTKVEEGQ